MGLEAVGSTDPISTMFNSAKLTINGAEIGEITNVSLTLSQNTVKTYTLNKRIASKIRAGNYEHSGSFDVEGGVYVSIISAFAASSSAVTDGTDYESTDSQPAANTVYVTAYEDDDTSKPIQFQLVDPIFSDISPTFAQESFGKQTIEFQCRDMVVFVDDDVSQ